MNLNRNYILKLDVNLVKTLLVILVITFTDQGLLAQKSKEKFFLEHKKSINQEDIYEETLEMLIINDSITHFKELKFTINNLDKLTYDVGFNKLKVITNGVEKKIDSTNEFQQNFFQKRCFQIDKYGKIIEKLALKADKTSDFGPSINLEDVFLGSFRK